MLKKDKPISYMETHAGRGLYNLAASEAVKTGEANYGIKALLQKKQISVSDDYVALVKKIQNTLGQDFYPGSPMMAALMLRVYDEINLMELHPQEYKALHHIMYDFSNVHVHHRDGYEGVMALSPMRAPKPSRGIILIDPSYEEKDEYMQVAEFVKKLHKRWDTAVILVWYPILKQGYYADMKDAILKLDLPKLWLDEVRFSVPSAREGIKGSGMIMVNTPFEFRKDERNVAG